MRQSLRKQILAIRKSLDASFCRKAAERVTNKLINSNFYRQSYNIAIYLDIKNELPTKKLIEQIWQAKKNCYLPILAEDNKSLHFIKYNENSILIKNYLGILEPVFDDGSLIAPSNLDLVITPLVGFDIYGNRLGMGGGFYDRTFAFKKQSPNEKPLLIGIGYEFQKIEAIKNETWDVKLDYIITENSIYKTKNTFS